jgi:small subunit ribosomal protein S3Ae
MAIGGKKGGKRKTADPMTRKEWYDVVAPAVPGLDKDKRQFTKTLVNKTVALKRSEDNLKGRIFEVNLADLTASTNETNHGYRKMLFRVDHVVGRNCITNFHGMALTTDKLRSLIKKKCTLIEARTVVATTDGYMLQVSLIGFTARKDNQVKRNWYAQSSTVRQIRKRMVDHTKAALSKTDLQGCVKKFISELPASEMPRACLEFFPMTNVFIRKVKLLKSPKFDVSKLLDAHGGQIPVSREERGLELK